MIKEEEVLPELKKLKDKLKEHKEKLKELKPEKAEDKEFAKACLLYTSWCVQEQ